MTSNIYQDLNDRWLKLHAKMAEQQLQLYDSEDLVIQNIKRKNNILRIQENENMQNLRGEVEGRLGDLREMEDEGRERMGILQQYCLNKDAEISKQMIEFQSIIASHNKIQTERAQTMISQHQQKLQHKISKISQASKNSLNQFKLAKDTLKNKLKLSKQSYQQSLDSLYKEMVSQISQINQFIDAQKQQSRQNSLKIQSAAQQLYYDLEKVAQVEFNEGKVTYDCLLTLIEECVCQLQKKSML